MQKYHKNDRKSSTTERGREIYKTIEKENESARNFSIAWNALVILAYALVFASEALTGLLILISEYGGKTIICNKVIICRWRSCRET